MEIDNSLRELRLFKGQGAWRFFMAWCLVFVRLCLAPVVAIGSVTTLLWLALDGQPQVSNLLVVVIRAIKQLNW
jgi:hypothetical protein